MDQLVKFLGSLQSYFNDFIGAIAPAIVFVLCVPVVSGVKLPIHDEAQWGKFSVVFAVVFLFALGHVLLAISELIRKRIKIGPTEWVRHQRIDHSKDSAGKEFVKLLQAKGLSAGASLPSNVIRNIAMTVSDDGRELGRRFMFLALFCYGSATALFLAAIAGTCASLYVALFGEATAQFDGQRAFSIALAFAAWWLLIDRGFGFERRAEYAPIGTALAEILVKVGEADAKSKAERIGANQSVE